MNHLAMWHSLLRAFEYSTQPLAGRDGAVVYGLSDRRLQHLKKENNAPWPPGMMVQVGYSGVYEIERGNDSLLVGLNEGCDEQYVSYRCPESYRIIQLPLAKAAVWQVSIPKLLALIASKLDMVMQPTTVVEHLLWELGPLRLAPGFHLPVVVVRNLSLHLDKLMTLWRSQRRPLLILSTQRHLPEHIHWPDEVCVCSLYAVLQALPHKVVIDKDRLYRMAVGGLSSANDRNDDCPVRFDKAQQTLFMAGKPNWLVKGKKQALAVSYMVEQAQRDRWELRASDILAATNPHGTPGGAKRMQSLFSSSLEWQDYIESPRRGVYRFRLG